MDGLKVSESELMTTGNVLFRQHKALAKLFTAVLGVQGLSCCDLILKIYSSEVCGLESAALT